MSAATVLVHWLHLLALALWIGGLAVTQVVLPSGRRTRPEDVPLLESARRRAQSVMWWSLVALIVTLAAEIVLRTLALYGGDMASFTPTLRNILFESRYGKASVARWLLLVASLWAVDSLGRAAVPTPARAPRPSRHALGIVAGGPRRRAALSRAGWLRVATCCAAALLLATAASGAYGAAGPLSTIVDALRLGATALWLGGSIVLALTIAPFIMLVEHARRPAALLPRLDRFTPTALLGVLALALTGWWETGRVLRAPDLLASTFGSALALKIALYAVMIALSLWGLLVLRPRLRRQATRAKRDARLAQATDRTLSAVRRLLWVNPTLAVLALLLGAVGDVYPAPAASAHAAQGAAMQTARAGGITFALRATPRSAGANTFDLQLTQSGRPVTGADVALAAHSLQMRGMDPPLALAHNLGDGRYRVRDVLTMGGRWSLHVSLLHGATIAAANLALTVAPLAQPMSVTAAAQAPASGSGIWQPLGPAVIAHSLVADPRDRTRLYEGTIQGVYRSTDGGAHWTPASTGLFNSAREVWSLTLLPDGSLIAATGAGVYRSTDGAVHWRAAGLETRSIYTLAAHMAGHVVLLAGGDGGIYRSDDLAASWRPIFRTGAGAISSLAWPSIRPDLIVAGITPADQSIAVSRDGGATWQRGTNGLPGGPNGPGLMSVAVAPGAHDAYAGSMGRGAYALPGLTGRWQGRNEGLPGLKTGDAHIGSFAFDPANPAVIYAATPFGVYRTANAGRHWAIFGRGLYDDATVVTALALVTGPHPALYAATAAGLYRTPLAISK